MLPVKRHEQLNVLLLREVEHGEQSDDGAKDSEVHVVTAGAQDSKCDIFNKSSGVTHAFWHMDGVFWVSSDI